MRIHRFAPTPVVQRSMARQPPERPRLRDQFERGAAEAATCLPGAVAGGLIGVGIGLQNGLWFGLKPALGAAAVCGLIGGALGGAVSHSLAQMD